MKHKCIHHDIHESPLRNQGFEFFSRKRTLAIFEVTELRNVRLPCEYRIWSFVPVFIDTFFRTNQLHAELVKKIRCCVSTNFRTFHQNSFHMKFLRDFVAECPHTPGFRQIPNYVHTPPFDHRIMYKRFAFTTAPCLRKHLSCCYKIAVADNEGPTVVSGSIS